MDREARTGLVVSIRRLVAGLITNDEFEDNSPYSDIDPAIAGVSWKGAYYLYGDLREYRLIGEDRLPESARPEVAKWLLFLKSDLEYEWPPEPAPSTGQLIFALGNLLTLGLLGFLFRQRQSQEEDVSGEVPGDKSVWPFFRESDYRAALNHPPYLSGPNPVILTQPSPL